MNTNSTIHKIKKAVALGLFFGISLTGYAQQYPTFSDYGYNPYMINSAYSGLVKTPEVHIGYNGSFSSSQGSPRTLSLSGMVPFSDKNFALGASFISDKIGVTSFNALNVSYAYRLNLSQNPEIPQKVSSIRNHSLSFGIAGGIRFMNDDLLSLGMSADNRLAENNSVRVATLGIGVFYNHPDFFAGLSAGNLLGDKLSNNNRMLYVEQPYYLYGGYRFFVGMEEDAFIITPNILIKSNFKTPMMIDYNVNVNFRKDFDAGVGYRDIGSISISLGARVLDGFRLMYIFNKYTKMNYFNNSHGIMISYRF